MKKIVLIVVLLFSVFMQAQPPTKFYNAFGGDGDDIAYSGKQVLDGHYILAGSTTSYGSHGNTDAYLVKVDSMGAPMWHRYIGGFGNDVAKSVIQLPDSGYVIAGYTNSFGAGGYDAYIVKTDKNGNMIWQRTFGGQDWDFASDLVYGPDASIVVVGNTMSFGNGKKDGFAIKYDLAGNLLWQKFYGGAENEELRSIIKTNDNFFAAVGYTESGHDINGDCYFLKLNSNGDTLFTRTIGGPYKDYATDLVQKIGNAYVMSGAKTYSLNGKSHSYVYSLSSTGAFLSDTSRYASTDDEEFVSVANPLNLPTVTAFLRNVPVPGFKMQGNIYALNAVNYEYAINSFGGGEDEDFHSIEPTRDGGYVMVGSTSSFNSLGLDVFFIKIDDSVVITYTSVVGAPENKMDARSLVYYDSDNIIISFSEDNIPDNIDLYDIVGRLVKQIRVTEKDMRLDLSDLSNPIYLLKINYNDGSFYSKKIINR